MNVSLTPKASSRSRKNNKHKRSSSTVLLDCQSLHRSLKRVRLSSSPGELRLERDLLHAVQASGWMPVGDSVWHKLSSHCAAADQQYTVKRHAQDPLRFQVYIPVAAATLSLQIPRLYPHRPPLISTIVYNESTTAEGQSPLCQHDKSNTQQQQNNNRIQSILIAATPDDPAAAVAASCPWTVVLQDWNPLCTLDSVVDCLVHAIVTTRPNVHANHAGDDAAAMQQLSERDTINNNNNNSMRDDEDDDNGDLSHVKREPLAHQDKADPLQMPYYLTEADRATEKAVGTFYAAAVPQQQQQQQESCHHHQYVEADSTTVAEQDIERSLLPNRFDHGYERAPPMDLSK